MRPSYVCVLRNPYALLEAREKWPEAKLILWLHDLATPALGQALPVLQELKPTVVCVSDFHRTQVIEMLKAGGFQGEFPVRRIYNPIDDDLKPNSTPVDRNRLVWFSSPHKGLPDAIEAFAALRRFNPDFTFSIFNPGYFPSYTTEATGLDLRGPAPHREVLQVVRSSLCTFYPNRVFPETFGLVIAESNAVGTPVLTHPLGAANEVTDHPSELVDCRDLRAIVDRVMAWHGGERPIVRANPKFRLKEVLREWNNLLT